VYGYDVQLAVIKLLCFWYTSYEWLLDGFLQLAKHPACSGCKYWYRLLFYPNDDEHNAFVSLQFRAAAQSEATSPPLLFCTDLLVASLSPNALNALDAASPLASSIICFS